MWSRRLAWALLAAAVGAVLLLHVAQWWLQEPPLAPERVQELLASLGVQDDVAHTLAAEAGGDAALKPGAAFMLVHPQWRSPRGRRLCFFNSSLDRLQDHWRPTNPYPLYLLTTESFSLAEEQELRQRWPRLELAFVDISAYFPQVAGWERLVERKTKRFSLGYRHMCSFLFYRFLRVPELRQHRYLLRIDDDACLQEPVPVDLFRDMAASRSAYAYVSTFVDPSYVVKGLNAFAKEFMVAHALPWSHPALAAHQDLVFAQSGGVPAFATNWEIIDTWRYRQPDILAFVQAVHASGRIYTARWGDAPLRYLLASMFWRHDEVRKVCELKYRHGDWPVAPTCAQSTNADPVARFDLAALRPGLRAAPAAPPERGRHVG